jgi:hypothetical protein
VFGRRVVARHDDDMGGVAHCGKACFDYGRVETRRAVNASHRWIRCSAVVEA